MVIVRTPLRISFLGGGTDHPVWFRRNSGAVLSTTINKYVYLQMRPIPPIFEHNYRVVWNKVEEVQDSCDIQHPIVREVLSNYFSEPPGRFEMVYNADLPARSGLGASSAFAVALLQGLWAQKGKLITRAELAREAIYVEHELLKENVGWQDQVAVAYGGLNRVDFHIKGDFSVAPLPLPIAKREALESHMMLFFTRFHRSASDVEAIKLRNFVAKEKNMFRMLDLVDEGQETLLSVTDPISRFGALLDESWKLKRDLSDCVSNSDIDAAYEAAMAAGASGGKLLGAGGGGFLLFIVKPALQNKVRQALSNLVEVSIKLETRGSHLALFDADMDIAPADTSRIVYLERKQNRSA